MLIVVLFAVFIFFIQSLNYIFDILKVIWFTHTIF